MAEERSRVRALLPASQLPAVAIVVVGLLVLVLLFVLGAEPVAPATPERGTIAGDTREVVTEVAGAVAERQGELTPAVTDHLTVVHVSVTTCGERSTGSGVLVGDGILLTAAHVVGDAGLVRIDYRGVVLTGEVQGVFSDGRDLALIEIDAAMVDPITMGTVPTDGEAITVVGHPGGGPLTVTVGPRVAVPELATRVVAGDLVAVDAATPPGMSGGPAVDGEGDLIGILVAIEAATGTGIVIAIDDPASLNDTALKPGRCPTEA